MPTWTDAADVGSLLVDLDAESADLDDLVGDLPEADWRRPTPSPGWTIADQVAHLAWTDDIAALAAADPAAFEAALAGLIDGTASVDSIAARPPRPRPPAALLAWWRNRRARLAAALFAVPPGGRIPWFGPPMAAASMATARLMETWAHGQDIADALGVDRQPTARLRHVAHIGGRARDFAFAFRAHGLEPPADEFFIELTGPAGERWTWGPADAGQRVSGPALDFCVLVTQRRHRDDLAVTAVGTDAGRWLTIAQGVRRTSGRRPSPGAVRDERRCASLTVPGSTAIASARSARCSTAVSSTSSLATTSPS